MKTVFDNDMVRHLWAQQSQSMGRNAKHSLHFRDSMLFSYHTCIAKFVTHKEKRGVIITTNRYSVTTSGKHMPRESDIPAGVTVLRAPDVYGDHTVNLTHFKKTYEQDAIKLSRARINAEWMIRELSRCKAQARAYCDFFELPFNEADFPEPTPEQLAVYKAAALKAQQEKTREQKEREEKKRAMILESINDFLNNTAGDVRIDYRWEDVATPEQVAAVQAEAIRRFRRGHNLGNVVNLGDTALLRLEGEEIVTSQGARFPVTDAIRVFPLIVAQKEKAIALDLHRMAAESRTDFKWPVLGHFNIDKVTERGDVRAGCHYVKWEEIEAIAKQLNLV